MTCKTTCSCDTHGKCERHGIKKHPGWFKLCQTNQLFTDAWDNGTGPGQQLERSKEPTVIKTKVDTAALWRELHLYAVEHFANWDEKEAKRWYRRQWRPRIPKYGCSCQEHWKELEKTFPLVFDDPISFFESTWRNHNMVSETHSKRPTITLEEAYELYWSGK